MLPCLKRGLKQRAGEPSRGSQARSAEPSHVPGSALLGGGVHADAHHRFAELLHALDQVRSAWRRAVPEHGKDIAGLGQLMIAPHAGDLPEALPACPKELVWHSMLPGDRKSVV